MPLHLPGSNPRAPTQCLPKPREKWVQPSSSQDIQPLPAETTCPRPPQRKDPLSLQLPHHLHSKFPHVCIPNTSLATQHHTGRGSYSQKARGSVPRGE